MKPSRVTLMLVVVPLVVGGTLHFVIPATYEKIVPKPLGHARGIVFASGAIEVIAGLLLASKRTRPVGGWLAAAVLVAIFPANLQMALDSGSPVATASGATAWLRLPLQIPLVVWALQHARAGADSSPRRARRAAP